MSALHSNTDRPLANALDRDLSFDILLQLKVDGKATRELAAMLPDALPHDAVSSCLENLRRVGPPLNDRTIKEQQTTFLHVVVGCQSKRAGA